MHLSLPQSLQVFVEKQVARGEYSSTCEYVRELIRREHDCMEIRRRLHPDSEPPLRALADDEYFEGLRAH